MNPEKKLEIFLHASETYFKGLNQVRKSGGGTPERSQYTIFANFVTTIGSILTPKVYCVADLTNLGAGHPDFGLFTHQQLDDSEIRKGQIPERGVIELKPIDDDAFLTATSSQVAKYLNRYRLVLVTNLRDFVLLGQDSLGNSVKLETYRLADSEIEFIRKLDKPRAFAHEAGESIGEYLSRALTLQSTLSEPKDVAWLLASYARDGLSRITAVGETPFLLSVRKSLEQALGVRFEGEKGDKFFCSTLVQTLFYGIFSAWVLWSRDESIDNAPILEETYLQNRFNWREAVWYLRAPILRALFQQFSDPGRLQPLNLVEVLDWSANALNRVDRAAFFNKFDEGEAVPYFYEPFLEEFDPDLRKQLGVWYTPTEVVQYMVARVDLALQKDLNISAGLAAENVYVLDPCCGTGAYIAEVLRRIAHNLTEQGLGALVGSRIKRAAMKRVFGFEIMPAPYVVAHLQIGLMLQELDAHFSDDDNEHPSIFLTNALTGWESSANELIHFPEFQEERNRAEKVKQDVPIIVILGNPPYNGFADMAIEEERTLSDAYRTTKNVQEPKGRGLNDLYVRFFRMADRRIVETTGQGIICFISNYSWLDGLSFTGMRERFLETFDRIQIDSLNGDRYRTGKTAPDGSPDPSIFSTEQDPVGIQVGTAITTLIRKLNHSAATAIHFRNLWGTAKREELISTAEIETNELYDQFEPELRLGFPFTQSRVCNEWFDWPTLPELFPVSFPGVNTSRDRFLIDIDLKRLRTRIFEYFDKDISNDEIAKRYPSIMKTTAHFDGENVRDGIVLRDGPDEAGFIRYLHRPFDNRWLYWEKDYGILNRPRPNYKPHVVSGNIWLSAAEHIRKGGEEPQANFTCHMGSMHLIERGAKMFPAWLIETELWNNGDENPRVPNLSSAAQEYLERIGLGVEDLFYYVLLVLHDPNYLNLHSDSLCMGWPRIPLPGWPKGNSNDARETIISSVDKGKKLACLLNPESSIPGVTEGKLRSNLVNIAVPSTESGMNMKSEDFLQNVGWSYFSQGAVMPGQGKTIDRQYSLTEWVENSYARSKLGETTTDIYLNKNAFWRNVPINVWEYKLGGYQVLKKWLSYRENTILGRSLMPEEVQYFTEMSRRIATILLEFG